MSILTEHLWRDLERAMTLPDSPTDEQLKAIIDGWLKAELDQDAVLRRAAYIRSCMVQIGALVLAAVTVIELKEQLAWVPEAAWWIGGFLFLFSVACYVARQNHLWDEKAKAKAARRAKSLDEAIERARNNRQREV